MTATRHTAIGTVPAERDTGVGPDSASAGQAPAVPQGDGREDAFAGLQLRPELLTALTGLGYEKPNPVQREAIPPLVQGRDLQGQAATGTGRPR